MRIPRENKTPWYLTPDVKPPKDFNPYTDEKSVLTEIIEENPRAFCGTEKSEYETESSYESRRKGENEFTRGCAEGKLKKALTSVALWLLLTLLLTNSLSSALVMLDGFIPAKAYSVLYHVALLVAYAGLFPVTFFVASVGNKTKSLTFFKKPDASKFYVFRWVIIIFGVTHTIALAFRYLFILFEKLGLHVNQLQVPSTSGVLENVLYFIAIVICAPIFEEILFRGFILTRLSRFGSWFAIITSAVLFGLYHQNHEQLFFTAVFGVLTGFVALRTKSVLPTVIAHVLINGQSYFLSLAQSYAITGGEGASTEITLGGSAAAVVTTGLITVTVYALMAIGVVLLISEIALNRAQFSLPKGDSKLTKGDKIRGFFANPSMILLLIIYISNLILASFIDINEINAMLEQLYQI